MKYKFNINISEKDYLDYNVFYQVKSPYGKKQITFFRIFIAVLIFLNALLLLKRSYSIDSFIGITPIVLVGITFEVFFNRILYYALKLHIKILSKKGKMGYSSSSVITFNEDSFTEITQENKMEQKYSAIERISIIDKKMIYIHVNNLMAYILPISCFETKDQYDQFFEFMKTKCKTIDIYK